jgi:hypothetical protein
MKRRRNGNGLAFGSCGTPAMCFSAEASFTLGAVLIPAGVYCVQAAGRFKPRWLALAVMPFFFSLQQIGEGFVWLGLQRGDAQLTRGAALVFLLPALAGWPFWLSFLNWSQETPRVRKGLLLILTVCSTAWFWVLYFPILISPEATLTVQAEHHSITYNYDNLLVFQYVSRFWLKVLYLLTVSVPFLISSEKKAVIPPLLVAGSMIVTVVFFGHAFVSVWCFFAAVLSVALVWLFHGLAPSKTATTSAKVSDSARL